MLMEVLVTTCMGQVKVNHNVLISHTLSLRSVVKLSHYLLIKILVGYDFGTTVGIIHAEFLNPKHLSHLGQSQDNQPVKTGEKCTTLEYTVLTKHDAEVLWLQTSAVPIPIPV